MFLLKLNVTYRSVYIYTLSIKAEWLVSIFSSSFEVQFYPNSKKIILLMFTEEYQNLCSQALIYRRTGLLMCRFNI